MADEEIAALPRDSCPVRIRNRCVMTSRPRGVKRRWRLSRIVFRHLADHGQLSGVQRAIWWPALEPAEQGDQFWQEVPSRVSRKPSVLGVQRGSLICLMLPVVKLLFNFRLRNLGVSFCQWMLAICEFSLLLDLKINHTVSIHSTRSRVIKNILWKCSLYACLFLHTYLATYEGSCIFKGIMS